MTELFYDTELAEPIEPLTHVRRGASTPETRERYAFRKTKKVGTCWEENGRLYRMGPQGVAVFDPGKWGTIREHLPKCNVERW